MSEIYEALQKAAKSTREAGVPNSMGNLDMAPHMRATESTAVTAVLEPPAEAAAAATAPTRHGQERRKRCRAQVKMPAGVRSSQSISNAFREVVTTENASRDGLCFRTNAKHYEAGMLVRVSFPYNSHAESVPGSENSAYIVRLESMADGSSVVAVSFCPASYTTPSSHVHTGLTSHGIVGQRPAERRKHKRHEISARAEVREPSSESIMNARCSELSLGGCYIDTLNPFLIGTHVQMEIQKGDRVFTVSGTVRSSHRGSGMGLSFHELTPEQTAILFGWLEQE